MINTLLICALLLMLLVSALLILRNQSPLTVTILSGVYSLVICTLFVIMDAVDVAFTEAAVGAGISSVLILSVIKFRDEAGIESKWPSSLSICLGLGVGLMLIIGSMDMPYYGAEDAPIHGHLAPRFLQQSGAEIGIPNVVTSVLASYRGYDTLGEVVVVFTAGIAVLMLLWSGVERTTTRADGEDAKPGALIDNILFKNVLLRIIPLVILFALYVQFHGDYGPGGGFQAGVIFGAGLITFGLLSNPQKLCAVIAERWITFGMAFGVLLYALVGVVAMFRGGSFLNYSVLAQSQTTGQHIGILVIELGVGITVACTMISLFLSFNRGQE